MALYPGQYYFLVGGSETISLTSDVQTDSFRITEVLNWVIQPVEVTGTDGTPTYTLEYSMDGLTWDDYDTPLETTKNTDIEINKTMRGSGFSSIPFLRMNISMNGNTTGTCKIVIGKF